jgi:4'-phosphopantetheinyl transferase
VERYWPLVTEFPGVSDDEAQVFAVALDQVGATDDELLSTLSGDERERANRFQLDKPRRQFVVGRAVLRMLLGTRLNMRPADIALVCDEHGKPRLYGTSGLPELRFNLANSDDVILVGTALGCEIGVDVERLRAVSPLEEIAHRYFHQSELQEISAVRGAERDAAFLRCWTGKEAVLKAVGSGLSESLAGFRVPAANHDGTWINIPSTIAGNAASCWLQSLTPSNSYVGAIACFGAKRRASCYALRI